MTTSAFGAFQPNSFFDQFDNDFFSQASPFAGFDDFLEEDEGLNLSFQGALNRSNLPSSQRKKAQEQRQDIFSQFQGLQRFDPTQRFTPFIENFDFRRNQFQTPLGGGRTSPRTSFIR